MKLTKPQLILLQELATTKASSTYLHHTYKPGQALLKLGFIQVHISNKTASVSYYVITESGRTYLRSL